MQGNKTPGWHIQYQIGAGRDQLIGRAAQSLPDGGAGDVQKHSLMGGRKVHFQHNYSRNDDF